MMRGQKANPEWTSDTFKRAKLASEVLSNIVAAHSRGWPKADNPKVSTTIRLSPNSANNEKIP